MIVTVSNLDADVSPTPSRRVVGGNSSPYGRASKGDGCSSNPCARNHVCAPESRLQPYDGSLPGRLRRVLFVFMVSVRMSASFLTPSPARLLRESLRSRTVTEGAHTSTASLENPVYISSNNPAASVENPNDVNVGPPRSTAPPVRRRLVPNPAKLRGHLQDCTPLDPLVPQSVMASPPGNQSLRCHDRCLG